MTTLSLITHEFRDSRNDVLGSRPPALSKSGVKAKLQGFSSVYVCFLKNVLLSVCLKKCEYTVLVNVT